MLPWGQVVFHGIGGDGVGGRKLSKRCVRARPDFAMRRLRTANKQQQTEEGPSQQAPEPSLCLREVTRGIMDHVLYVLLDTAGLCTVQYVASGK